MKYTLKKLTALLLFFLLAMSTARAAYPGGVGSGTVHGWKVKMYKGYFTNPVDFGTGRTNTTPYLWGYQGKVDADPFSGYYGDNFSLEYNATLTITTAGTYTFNLYSIDNQGWLYIDDVLQCYGYWTSSGGGGNKTIAVALTAGDHTIRVKFSESAGGESIGLQAKGGDFGTAYTAVDGRFVHVDGAKLAGWYCADSITVSTAKYVQSFINKAPDFKGNGNLSCSNTTATAYAAATDLVNSNPAVMFNGNDWFGSRVTNTSGPSQGLSYRTADISMYGAYTPTVNNSDFWVMAYGGSTGDSQSFGIWKNSSGFAAAVHGAGVTTSSVFSVSENKVMNVGQYLTQGTSGALVTYAAGNGATATTGSTSTNVRVVNGYTLELGGYSSANVSSGYIPEVMVYPFKLTATQTKQLDSYMAIKYGTTLAHSYLNSSADSVFNYSTNSAYKTRVFGIGRDDNGALYQKQSQSTMVSATPASTNNFLKIGVGAIAASNAANTNTLTNGVFVMVGDNAGTLTAQTSELPSTFTGVGTRTRINREWKAQVKGTAPTNISMQAGYSGEYLFPVNAAGVTLLVDADGDGDFTTGTVRQYTASGYQNRVATFTGVTLNSGEVFTFAWSATSPGGVAASLVLWMDAGKGTATTTDASSNTTWIDLSNTGATGTGTATYLAGSNTAAVNYNPVIAFNGSSNGYTLSGGTSTSTAFQDFTAGTTGFSVLNTNNGSVNSWGRILHLCTASVSNNNLLSWNRYNTNSEIYLDSKNAGGTTIGTPLFSSTSALATANGYVLHGMNISSGTAGSATGASAALYYNGKSIASSTAALGVPTSISRTYNYVGYRGSDSYLNGYLPELILYNRALTATERQQVNSYLAIKYGLTIDQTTATNYLSSGSSPLTLWNATTNATYKNNIFGIGRDDASGLNQLQSKSTVSGDHVSVALGTLAASNAANTSSFSADKMFLIIGDDGKALTDTTTNIPSSYGSDCGNARRYIRTWKVQNTGSVGVVSIVMGNNTSRIARSMTNPQLAVNTSGDATFATGTTVLYSPTSYTRSGVATFSNVSLPDGAVFTLCYTRAAPGGVNLPAGGATPLGATYVNGLKYKFYTGTSTDYPVNLDMSTLSKMPGTLQSTGYLSNLTDIDNISNNKADTYCGIEITGKFYLSAGLTGVFIRGNTVDDKMCIIIDGTTVVNATTFGTSPTSTSLSLNAGIHDIVVRCGQNSGGINWNIDWNGGGGGTTYVAIPDSYFFVQPQGPSAWYASDDNAFNSLASGASVALGTAWPDQTANINDLAVNLITTLKYNSTASLRNYNEQLYFVNSRFTSPSAAYLNGFPYGKQGKTQFAVQSYSYMTSVNNLFGWGNVGTTSQGQGLFSPANGGLGYFGWGSDFSLTSFWTTTNATNPITTLISSTYDNDNITTSNYVKLYNSNSQLGQGTVPTPWNTYMRANSQLQIGNQVAQTDNSIGWDGNINEIIVYPWTLTATERQKVNSYLSLKWGLTQYPLGTSYLNSAGTAVFTPDATFKYDVTGIGRDDCSSLYQLQSTSTDSLDIVSIAKDTLATSNSLNTSEFSVNNTYLIFAHNNGLMQGYYSDNIPSTLTAAGCYVRSARIWKVQKTGTVDGVQIALGKGGLKILTRGQAPRLMVSASSTDFSNATVYKPSKIKKGIAYFDNVSFPAGTSYFAYAFVVPAPGGVSAGLVRWFNAAAGVYSDVDYSDVNDGDKVYTWHDFAEISEATQATTSAEPNYQISKFNFNPAILYTGSQYLVSGSTSLPTGATPINSMGVLSASATSTTYTHSFSYGTLASHGSHFTVSMSPSVTSANADYYNYMATAANGFSPLGSPKLIYAGNNSTSACFISSNLGTPTTSTGTLDVKSSNLYIGSRFQTDMFWKGSIAEFCIYNQTLSDGDQKKIASYEALKYGFTLASSNNVSYFSSRADSVYNYATHWNRITGIGRDVCSLLDQRQSRSQETAGMVTISTDSINGVCSSNLANNVPVGDDVYSYDVFGDDGKSLTWTSYDNPKSTELVRLYRTWRVKETGTVGSVYIDVPANAYAKTSFGKLPATDTGKGVYLIVANTSTGGKFGAASGVSIYPMTLNSDSLKYYTTVNFKSGDYFTFGTEKFCVSCAGIEGVSAWYRPDSLAAINVASGGTWTDQMGNYNLTATGASTLNAGSTGIFNYNPYITLGATSYFTKAGLSESSGVVGTTEGAMAGVVGSFSNTFGLTKASAFPAIMAANDGSAYWNGSSFAPNTANRVLGSANVSVMNKTASKLRIEYNSAGYGYANTDAIPTGTYSLNVGALYNGASLAYNTGNVAEFLTTNQSLSDAEKSRINTYLAIKYGQTLLYNYVSPDYDGTNASTETLYNVNTYGNRITGIGKDLGGCLNQRQSKSVLSTAVMILNASDSIYTTNKLNPGTFMTDPSYLITGDDSGDITAWTTTGLPVIENALCNASCVTRKWRITSYGDDMTGNIFVYDDRSSNATKLPALTNTTDYALYLVVNGSANFATSSNMQEISMKYHSASGTWSAPVTVPKGTTLYYTVVQRLKKCRRGYEIVNPATAGWRTNY